MPPPTTKLQKPRIFLYGDFRQYLNDFFAYAKHKNPRFSYRGFAKKASLSSPNYLQTILQRKRRVGGKTIEGLIAALGLNDLEAEYFKNLVFLDQAKTAEEANTLRQELARICPHADKKVLAEKIERYLGHWIYPLLREAAQLKEFSPDPYWLANRLYLDLPSADVREAFTFLLSEGYLARNGESYQPRDSHIITSDDVLSKYVQQYHRIILDNAQRMIDKVPLDAREFRAITFKAPSSSLPVLRNKIRAFRDEMLDLVNTLLKEEEADTVVQLNIQMFPTLKTD